MEYQEVNETEIDEEKLKLDKAAEEYGNEVPSLKLLAGKTMVRILPAHKEAVSTKFFREIHRHEIYQKGQRPQLFACPKVMQGTDCPACDKGEELLATRDPDLMRTATDKFRPKKKYIYNVLCQSSPVPARGDPTVFGKVYVMEAGVKTHKQIITLDRDKMSGWHELWRPENGVNLIITRTGTDMNNTEYIVIPNGAGRTNLFEDCKARGIDHNLIKVYNLELLYPIMPVDEIEAIVATVHIPKPAPSDPPTLSPALPAVSPAPALVAPAVAPPVAPAPATAPPPAPGLAPPAPPSAALEGLAPLANPGLTAPAPATAGETEQEAPVPPAIPAPPTE